MSLRLHISSPPDSYLSEARAEIAEVLAEVLGVKDDVAGVLAETENIEHHIHNVDRWMCRAVSPSGEVNIADVMSTVVSPNTAAPFRLTSGNNTWGAWVQLLGSSDTPVIAAKTHYDPNLIYIVDMSHATTTYLIQIAWGASGAAALAAGTYTETLFTSGQTVAASDGVQMVRAPQIAAGTKLWARVLTPGQNARWIDTFIDLHEYAI